MSEDSWKRRLAKKAPKRETKFRASVDKFTSLTLYQKEGGIYLIIKKDLVEYDLNATTSEAPIMNQFLKVPDPFECLLADAKIIEKELAPVNEAIQHVFGVNKEISLNAVKLAIGSGENDFVTIDESDLAAMDIEATIQGLTDFVQSNKESVIGLMDRIFEHEKGNLILLDSRIRDPSAGIVSIDIKLISSLQQRGMAMQKHMKYAILQRYIIIKADVLNDNILSFLKEIDIDWEMIFIRRELAMDSWIEIECERNSVNLKGFISTRYEALGAFDVQNIVRVCVSNQLTFKIADRMADLLNQVKAQRQELTGALPDAEPLRKAEIVAAAKVACAYYGLKKEIKVEQDISPIEIAHFEEELIRF